MIRGLLPSLLLLGGCSLLRPDPPPRLPESCRRPSSPSSLLPSDCAREVQAARAPRWLPGEEPDVGTGGSTGRVSVAPAGAEGRVPRQEGALPVSGVRLRTSVPFTLVPGRTAIAPPPPELSGEPAPPPPQPPPAERRARRR